MALFRKTALSNYISIYSSCHGPWTLSEIKRGHDSGEQSRRNVFHSMRADKGSKLSRSCFPGLELLIGGNRVGGIHQRRATAHINRHAERLFDFLPGRA